MIRELPANDILHVNKFTDLQKLYLQTIISVCHIYIMKYFFYKLKWNIIVYLLISYQLTTIICKFVILFPRVIINIMSVSKFPV
jgi:hypothetical protein